MKAICLFVSSLSLFWTRVYVGERWGSLLCYLFSYALSLLYQIGLLLFWCIKINGAKTLLFAVHVCLLVSRTSGGLLDQLYVLVMHEKLKLE
jgi:hypothetical protein